MMMERRPAPRKPTRRRPATAYHEAGHTVAGLLLGFKIKSVTIVPGEGFLGKVKHRKDTHFYKSLEFGRPSQRRGEEHIIYRLAGLVAERRFNARARSEPAKADHEHAADLVSSLNGGDEKLANAHIKYLWLRTDRLIAENWPLVEAVAQALLEKETLKPDDIRAIAREQDALL